MRWRVEHLMNWLYVTGAVTLFTILWEHVFSINKLKATPSWLIGELAHYVRDGFSFIGRVVAYVSSFYVYLHLGDLVKSILSLLKSIGKLLLAPFWFFSGYARILDLYDAVKQGNGVLIILGTLTVLGGIAYGLFWYFDVSTTILRGYIQNDKYMSIFYCVGVPSLLVIAIVASYCKC